MAQDPILTFFSVPAFSLSFQPKGPQHFISYLVVDKRVRLAISNEQRSIPWYNNVAYYFVEM